MTASGCRAASPPRIAILRRGLESRGIRDRIRHGWCAPAQDCFTIAIRWLTSMRLSRRTARTPSNSIWRARRRWPRSQSALGGSLTAPFGSAGLAVYRPSAIFPPTYSRKVTAGVERRIDADTTFTAEYANVRGLRLPRIRSYELEQTANSTYQGAALSLHRRLRKDLSYLFTYSLAITHDDGSDYDEQPMDPSNIRADWGLSRQDQRHRFAASGLFDLPLDSVPGLNDITLAPIFTAGSGRPVNTCSPRMSCAPGHIRLRPARGFARNTATSPATVSLDLRVMKTIRFHNDRSRLQFGLESFNLLNHTNVLRVDPYYTPSFGLRWRSTARARCN